MKTCVFCFSDSGSALALRLCKELSLDPCQVHSIGKFASKYGFTSHDSVCADMKSLFEQNDALVFIGACGIAVRDIAPHLKSKTEDPAVIVIDDRGRFVIPILSGHIGGANRLAGEIASKIGAVPVITTATDGAHRFSCDQWAATHDCEISSMDMAKEVSSQILVRDIPVSSEFDLSDLPDGLVHQNDGDLGIYIGIKDINPYENTLRLIPKIVTVGVGCRRGLSGETVFERVSETLEQNKIDIRSVNRIATIDVKKDEDALKYLARKLNTSLLFFSAKELESVPGEFSESDFVRQAVGTGNVCERAAVLAGGKLIVPKNAGDGVTVAVSVKEWEIEF